MSGVFLLKRILPLPQYNYLMESNLDLFLKILKSNGLTKNKNYIPVYK